MRLFRHYQHLPVDIRGAAVAIGNFDGIHLGHRQVISEAGGIARADGVPWAVLTFEPHPRCVFKPDTPPFRLTPFPMKARLIEAIGVDLLIVVPFDIEFSKLTAHDFVDQVLVAGLGARHVICGHDFAFGHGRKGTPEQLLWFGDEFGFNFTCVQEVRDAEGEPYSSTRIRNLLAAGDPQGAARILDRPFEIEGQVIKGDRRGRTIGFPTANIELGEYVRPALGVYAVRVASADEGEPVVANGVVNIGVRPTVDGSDVRLEAHLFDWAGDLYGRWLKISLIDFLRPEKKFDGLASLTAQISEDCAQARERLSAQSNMAPRLRIGTP